MGVNLRNPQEMVKDRKAWHGAVHGVTELDMTQQMDKSNKRVLYALWDA